MQLMDIPRTQAVDPQPHPWVFEHERRPAVVGLAGCDQEAVTYPDPPDVDGVGVPGSGLQLDRLMGIGTGAIPFYYQPFLG